MTRSTLSEPITWRRTLSTASAVAVITLLTAAIAAVVVYASDVLFLTFLGVVLGVVLRRCAVFVGGFLGGRPNVGLGVTVFVGLAVAAGAAYFMGDRIASQVDDISQKFDESVSSARESLKKRPAVRSALLSVPGFGVLLSEEGNKKLGQAAVEEATGQKPKDADKKREDVDNTSGGANAINGQVTGSTLAVILKVFRTSFGVLGSTLVVLVLGVFLAADPPLYRDGAAKLVPADRRSRFVELANDLSETLWRWTGGRLITMAVTGLGIGVAMAVLGVPLPVFLGLFAAAACLVPNIGAAVTLFLAVVLSAPQGFGMVATVTAVFVIFQVLESNVLTPLVQQQAVAMPPALLLVNQLLFGVLFGFLGLLVSTPLLAVTMVLVDRVYVRDEFELLSGSRRPSAA